ncbi:PLDc N-terminal domain-containing protein [Chryseobacterium sp. RU33C]|nr:MULTISPECIES: PLDc N-terminal domain-containing protein [unclassified Chryseobacterium]
MIFFAFLLLVIFNFIFVLIKIQNDKNRLLWHLLICFFPVIGPLIYLANKKKIA